VATIESASQALRVGDCSSSAKPRYPRRPVAGREECTTPRALTLPNSRRSASPPPPCRIATAAAACHRPSRRLSLTAASCPPRPPQPPPQRQRRSGSPPVSSVANANSSVTRLAPSVPVVLVLAMPGILFSSITWCTHHLLVATKRPERSQDPSRAMLRNSNRSRRLLNKDLRNWRDFLPHTRLSCSLPRRHQMSVTPPGISPLAFESISTSASENQFSGGGINPSVFSANQPIFPDLTPPDNPNNVNLSAFPLFTNDSVSVNNHTASSTSSNPLDNSWAWDLVSLGMQEELPPDEITNKLYTPYDFDAGSSLAPSPISRKCTP